MLKKEAAALLNVTPARVSQLIKSGDLRPEPDGSVTAFEVERVRRSLPWQPDGFKSGRKSAAQYEQERQERLWYLVAQKLRALGYQGWTAKDARKAHADISDCVRAVAPGLTK
jgi:hypothetical protein